MAYALLLLERSGEGLQPNAFATPTGNKPVPSSSLTKLELASLSELRLAMVQPELPEPVISVCEGGFYQRIQLCRQTGIP